MMNTPFLLKAVLAFIAVFHLVFGAGLMFSQDFQQAALSLYGSSLELQSTNTYLIRIIGSFAFVLGYLALAACRDPLRHKTIIIGFIGFFVLRNISRHIYAEEVYAALSISQVMNVMTSFFFGLQALLLAYLLWRSSRVEAARQRKPL